VRVFSCETGRKLCEIELCPDYTDDDGRLNVDHLALSRDGSRLATIHGRSIGLWDVRTRSLQRAIRGGLTNDFAIECAFSPDARRLLVVSGDRAHRASLVDTTTGSIIGGLLLRDDREFILGSLWDDREFAGCQRFATSSFRS